MESSLGIITVWYHGEENIDRFATNRRNLPSANFLHVHIINALNEDALLKLKKELPDSTFIVLDTNVGVAAAWNAGIQFLTESGVKYIGIWNPDVVWVGDSLSELIRTLESDHSIGAACPVLLFSDEPEIIQMFGGSVDLCRGRAKHDYRLQPWSKELPAIRDAGYLDGGTMVFRSAVFAKVGLLDEEFFLYGEDTDLSIRIQGVGLRTVAVRDATVLHYHRENRDHKLPPYQIFYATRNLYYLVRKHGGRMCLLWMTLRSLWEMPLRLARYLKNSGFEVGWAFLTGNVYGIFGLMGKRKWTE
jgi:GT2 family glycosyltransferase